MSFDVFAAIQSELLYHRSESEPSLMELTHQCFHLVAYTDVIAHALNPMFQVGITRSVYVLIYVKYVEESNI